VDFVFFVVTSGRVVPPQPATQANPSKHRAKTQIKTMKKICLLFALFATVAALAQPDGKKKTLSPPETYQLFLVALVQNDRAALEQLCLPNKDLSVLAEISVPADHRDEALAQIKASPYRLLKPGELFVLPDGKPLSLTKAMEKKGWSIVVCEGDPQPHMLQKSATGWKVDAGDLIAARKAAAAQK